MRDFRGAERTALVTGASAGIGAAIAVELARRGAHVILAARRAERLDRVPELCREAARGAGREITTYALPIDLSTPESVSRLSDELARRKLDVDVLVNNAGYGQARRFHASTWEQHRAFLQLMLVGVVELTHRLLPPMLERNYGRILHVASLASNLPGTPGDTLYGPTKAFLVKFAQGHAGELAGTDVKVSALCPGYTYSEFHDVSGTREKVKTLPALMWSEAAPVAREGVEALLRGDALHTPGRFNRFARGVLNVLPDRLVMAAYSKRPTAR